MKSKIMYKRFLRIAVLGLVAMTMMAGECSPIGPGTPTGAVTGQVTVDGAGRPGVTVTLRIGTTTIATTQTEAGGTFTFANVVTEAKTVAVTPPSGTVCDPTQRDVTVTGGGTATANFTCTTPPPQTATVTGTVTVDGAGMSGIGVTLGDWRTTKTIATTTTDQAGAYRFSNVAIGTKTVSIEQPSGANCAVVVQYVTLQAGGTRTVSFACSRPTSIAGRVSVDGAGVSGVAVTLRDGTTTIATTTTGRTGMYQFFAVGNGTKTVSIAKPSGAICPKTQQDVTVPAGGLVMADFPCTTSTPQPPPQPPNGSSFSLSVTSGHCYTRPGRGIAYIGLFTNPPQRGASYSISWTGLGTGGRRSGVLDFAGQAYDEANLSVPGWYIDPYDHQGMGIPLGEFTVTYSVTAEGRTLGGSRTHGVSDLRGPCLQRSSIRYKRGVVSLLPDDMRPLGLNPVAFRYVEPYGDPAVPRIGLIAEEVVEVFPGAILLDPEGQPYAIDYRVLTASVIEEMEARAVDATRAAIARLADGF